MRTAAVQGSSLQATPAATDAFSRGFRCCPFAGPFRKLLSLHEPRRHQLRSVPLHMSLAFSLRRPTQIRIPSCTDAGPDQMYMYNNGTWLDRRAQQATRFLPRLTVGSQSCATNVVHRDIPKVILFIFLLQTSGLLPFLHANSTALHLHAYGPRCVFSTFKIVL